MRNQVILTLILLITLTACSPQDTPRNITPNSQLSEISTDYSGDGSDLILAWIRDTDEPVLITQYGAIILHIPDGEWYWFIGEGMVYVKGTGAIDLQGNVIFTSDFEHIGRFVDGLAPASVMEGNILRTGFINTSGEFVIEPQFEGALEFSEGLAAVCFDKLEMERESEWGFIDKSGKVVFRGFGRAQSFSEGLAVIKLKDKELFGYIGLDGSYVIKPVYQAASSFSEGVASVAEPTEDFADRKFGYIDRNGKYVLQPIYGSADDFLDGIAAVTFGDYTDNQYQMINRNGNVVLDTVFNSLIRETPDLFRAQELETLKEYFIDSTGIEILNGFLPFHQSP